MTNPAIHPNDTAAMRHAMVVSQLRTSGVSDARVVAAMGEVPRERFVPDAHRRFAYRDATISLGNGRYLNTPLATARLINEANVRSGDKVLLIGSATGYAAAVLARLAREVVALDSDPAMVAIARDALAGIANVALVEGPLAEGWAAGAPYDAIIVDGAVERFSDALARQVRPAGRIATGLVDRGVTRLAIGERTTGGFGLDDFVDLECAVLPGFEEPRGFTF
jgi:protein-L-isoaspartate(D-aspartate) O-methyltransferase